LTRRPVHISPSARVAEKVVAVGDPGRASRIAERLLEGATLESSNRGLLVYTGYWKGVEVTVATHGIGAPSSLIVFEELVMLGASRIVRLGTAGGVPGRAVPGDVVVASGSSMLRHGCGLEAYTPRIVPPLSPDPRLVLSLSRALEGRGLRVLVAPVFCSDSFYAETGLAEELEAAGLAAVEMESAALFALSHIRGFEAAAALIVSNELGGGFLPRDRLERLELEVASGVLDVLVNE